MQMTVSFLHLLSSSVLPWHYLSMLIANFKRKMRWKVSEFAIETKGFNRDQAVRLRTFDDKHFCKAQGLEEVGLTRGIAAIDGCYRENGQGVLAQPWQPIPMLAFETSNHSELHRISERSPVLY